MKLGKSASGYKKAYAYLGTQVQLFSKHFPKRFREYEHYCGNQIIAGQGTSEGKGPTLTIREFATLKQAGMVSSAGTVGFFHRDYPDAIFFNEKYIKKYEGNPTKYEICMQYLVMHELIHWARFHAGLPTTVAATSDRPLRGKRKGEAGDEFEFYAYGLDMFQFWAK